MVSLRLMRMLAVAVLGALWVDFACAVPAAAPSGGSRRGPGAHLGHNEEVTDISASATGSSPRGPDSLLGNDGEPINPSNVATVSGYSTAPGQTADPKLGFYLDFTQAQKPQPIRGDKGGTDPGPQNVKYDSTNSDLFAAPGTDSGDTPNAKWPMGLSYNRLGLKGAGWARQQNTAVLPVATDMAGVDMHLEPNAYHELHWHSAGEWRIILRGSRRVSAMNEEGKFYVDDLNEGDVWFFPSGIPHSIQAFDKGGEFLLIFDGGSIFQRRKHILDIGTVSSKSTVHHDEESADRCVGIQEFAGRSALHLPRNSCTDQHLSAEYDRPGRISGASRCVHVSLLSVDGLSVDGLSVDGLSVDGLSVDGGNVKIVDPEVFPIASMFSASLVTIHPSAMREVHWQPGRVTVFEPPESSRTFDYNEGDVGYIPLTQSHYIENTGSKDLIVLEAPKFTVVSVAQWMGLTPKQAIKDTLQLPEDVINCLPNTKPYILPGNPNMTSTNFTVGCGS